MAVDLQEENRRLKARLSAAKAMAPEPKAIVLMSGSSMTEGSVHAFESLEDGVNYAKRWDVGTPQLIICEDRWVWHRSSQKRD